MTSDKTEVDATSPSLAQTYLEYALGKHRIVLADLRPEEFDSFLLEHLHDVLLREIRGFTKLQDVLSIRGDDPMTVAGTTNFHLHSFDGHPLPEPINLRTQAAKVCRGVCTQHLLYRRMESETTTTDRKIADAWGASAYVHSGQAQILVLARPSKDCQADNNLFAIEYRFVKVLHERKYLIHTVDATQIPVHKFRDYFGEKAPEIAKELMWEIEVLHDVTLHALESQTQRMREELVRWERLSRNIG